MSYILKALKKSEAERAKGTVPRLTPQVASAPRSRRAVWPWIVGAALVVNATVVGFAAWGPEIQLLKGVGRQDGEAQIAISPAPVDDAAALTAAVPEAPANGTGSNGPAPAKPPDARPAAQTQSPPRQAAAQPGAIRVGPANKAQIQQRQVQQQQAQQQGAQQSANAQSQPPDSPRPAAQPRAPQQQAAALPQDQRQSLGSQPRPPAPQGATAQQAPPATPTEQDRQSRNAPAGGGAADGESRTAASPTVGSPPPSSEPAEPAASGVTTPKPARKPRKALSGSSQRRVLADPLPLGGSQRNAKTRRTELALAAPEPAPVETQAPPEPEPDPYAAVPMLWQLPSAIRSTLPKLRISVHVYSPEVEGRFVIVERSKYREGDVIAGGATLEAIVADGIVLDYRGRRYRIAN